MDLPDVQPFRTRLAQDLDDVGCFEESDSRSELALWNVVDHDRGRIQSQVRELDVLAGDSPSTHRTVY